MPGLLDYLNNALGLLNRVGPMGTLVPSQMRQASLGDFLRSANDTAQGVSRGMSADLLGAPVDITAQLMTVPRYLGAQTPDFTQSPVGGSQWFGQKMESMGLLRPPTNSADEMAGRVIGGMLATPSVVGAVGSTAERGLLAAGQNAMIPNRMSPQAGAIVWHGSPHKFDKFDSSKIGTGEGAQAYGHGLYLADEPTVAKSYIKGGGGFIPSQGKDNLYVDGKWVNSFDKNTPQGMAQYAMTQSVTGQTIAEKADSLRKIGRPDAAQWLEQNASRLSVGGGSLYKVDLPDDQIAKMLDWDKPLSQQAPEVQKALNKLPLEVKQHLGIGKYDDLKGGIDIVKPLGGLVGDSKATEMLRSVGIPGIRYLDGGSRGAGEGTRNYVVFPGNEDLLKILERK